MQYEKSIIVWITVPEGRFYTECD